MKKYRVVFTPTAQLHALRDAEFIALDSVANAVDWYEGLVKAVHSLDTMPGRWGAARESQYLHEELRQYIYKSHRIIFQIDEPAGIVYVLYIRHAARRAIGEMEEE